MFKLELSRDALEDLKTLRKSDRVLILDSLEISLCARTYEGDSAKKATSTQSTLEVGIADRLLPGFLRC